ncbi:hypothetical protein GLOIN_2v1665293 [Rhizophagus irregularis DAOM 181602=DAOM 197198]|uniref:VWFA domain-containing protein n=1 Tax=Rhizophagus irregularis (strain DAOM 181602 / DAOM 197198 / MUCL 43194) TaxID=747089 RepID=A0A2P4PJS6_RHIID|nr:hypothetical protein GLOIN_2v1665293 [Rhizophagus irregularis DAOM 181602=DAOM 197198]POG65607.1 hypothetical protein GLOIN_2v1665293 [Rhizophagus irregularis DAOM 181602=DAOM 197198]|eukprot:XP_025172473.1 hypothetical protein GLOIN_2v1665293 [Rhizophagus irregularis DAOM 181602=DAOM 197198]
MHVVTDNEYLLYQEVIDDSTVLINPTLAQQQITNNPSIVEDGNDSNESELSSSQFVNNNVVNQQQLDINSSSNVQGGNPSQKLTNDDANQQSPIESPQHNLSQIMNTNPFGDNNSQRSEGQQTFRPSDPIQDLSQIMNMNIFSSDNSQNDQQDYQNSSKGVLSEEQSTSFAFPKRSNSNSSIIEESGGNDANNELDFKENIRRVLKAQKSDLETQIKYGKDLAEHIPGLYRLLDLCKDDGSNGLVDKIIISKGSLKILCNEMIPLSFKSISDINFTKLNTISLRLIGCYGNHILIAKLLLSKKIINKEIYDLLANSQSSMDKSFLRPGLYLLLVNPDLGLVVHWPEIGCYEENASSQRKKNMTNLHRYLTKLTDHQLCLMSDKDLESFEWNKDNSDVDSDDDDDTCYEFEVKKSQEEQEDFKIYPGFEVNLSDKIKTEINNNIQDDIPLYPIVVESATNQSFVTRQLIKTASQLRSAAPIFTAFDFQRELQTRLKGRNLHINRETMNMKSLEILIKHGLKMEDELLGPLRNAIAAAKMKYDKKKDQEKDETSKDIEIISNLAWKKLRDSYSPFEDFIGQESSEHEHISDEDLERIRRKYPDMEAQIDKKILINSKAWGKLKKRYALTSIIVVDIFKMTKNAGKSNEEATIEIFYNMFVDEETDTHKLVKKHTEKPQSSGVFSGISNLFTAFLDIITFSSSSINRADEESIKISKTMSDKKFVQDLANSPFFGKFNDIKQKILGIFFEEYQNWRKNTFPSNIKEILPRVSFNKQLSERLTKEFEQEKQEIEDFEFDRICNVIEEKYQDGLFSNGYRFYHEIETTQPNQLQITIYETSLEQADILQLQEDELHVPNPTLPSHYSRGQSFHLDPQVYDFRKISQFDNHKFLLVLWNKRASKTEIFFDTAQKLAQNFKQSYSNRPFKTLNMDENYFIAVNESKELIAIFDTRKVVLNVFSFNDGQANLYSRNSNIQLLQWYSGAVPDIQYFLFIQDTEDLCFVEKGGRARIFNLVNQQFRPAVCNLPPNTANVLSSPDGSCIVAFVKEKIKVKNSTNDENETDEEDNLTDDEQDSTNRGSDLKEICRAYVYFCTNFGSSVSKVIDLPPTIQSLEYLHFTCINKLQIHLMSLDLENGCFNSIIVKITVERTQYRFQERVQKQSLGLVKVSHKNFKYTIIEGKNTRFEKIVQNGEHIVILGEKYSVLEVLSDTELKIDGNFKQKNGFDKWMEFRIDPNTNLNGLIDAYGLMFERYSVESCIDSEQNRPLSLKIVLDVDNDIEKYGEKFEDYIIEMFKNLKRSTKKPTSILEEFTTSVITFQKLDVENAKFQKKFSAKCQLGEWIIQLCCLIPIQIAVARNNLFQPLRDGLSSNDDHVGLDDDGDDGYGLHVDGIAKNISFGWYEGIFKHFGDKKVKVVSSMGEQSCGKSFMLNHLVGTTFDGSAMRCTEGVWMSLVNTKKYIYVALDFEGLKSLERTPQEDLFLTLFNTVVSNLILFKNQFAVNRDMSTMFQRFQDGATLFESDSKIFQAKLCIIIKDVPSADKEDIVREFRLKFSQLVSEEGEDNFISRMYKGGLDIIPWPMFNDASWFKTLSKVNKKLDKQEAKYENARTFLQNTKVIMAKLKICDWGSLDENLIQIRVATLKRLLPTVVAYGLEQKDSVNEQLMDRDSGEPIDDQIVILSDILSDYEGSTKILPDSDIQLYDEHESFERLSEDLRCYFEDYVQPRKESSNDREWFANFEKFFRYIIERRVLRVQNWYVKNTAKFPQDNNDVVNGKYAMEQELSKLTLLWTLCGLTCHQCGLKCVKNRDHKENHDCLTDHKCHFFCHFTEAHNDNLIPKCSHKAGHEGKHACDKISHLCGKPCSLDDKRNCQKVCSKEIGHDDSEHLCQSTIHYCGKDCSLSTHTQDEDYQCPNKCIKPYEEEHDSHRCENPICPIQCPIPNCKERCQSDDHFHAFSDLQVNHFCGNEHQCREDCQDDGICQVVTEPKKQEETYKGLVKETSITFTKYIQLSERLKCNKKIPPNEFTHTGTHTHKENGFHYCNAQCKFCEYYCTLPYGHAQQTHETRHGNMTQTEFTGEDSEFEYAGHKLRVGDQGTFVLCNLHCKDLGRHRHIDYCKNEENCKSGNQGQGQDIQHINEKVQPNPEKPKDFISHKLFWERTGFKDPYTVQEQQEFTKCDHECPDEKHHKSQGSSAPPPTKSFCELQLFHAPLSPSSNPPNGYGYISLDGHHFNCENPSTREAAFHIIFALDRSGSMSYNDKRPIPNFPIYNNLIRNHNNRTGAVYQAVYQFMEARINSARANQNQLSSAMRDSVSLILFDHEVTVPFENRDLTDPKDLLNSMLQHQARGGTSFDLAIQKAGFLITKYFDNSKANIVIFLSDGLCGVPANQLHTICNQNKTRGSPLYLYTVLFSSESQSNSLEEMAKIAQSYHPANTSSGALRCQFTRTVNEVNLVNHFTGVAESLRKHKPALLKKS